MKKELLKLNRGITLVSLIITIIILIILTSITLNLAIGDNGLFTIARQAKENMELAQIEEQERLNEIYSQFEVEIGNQGGEIEGDVGTSYDAIAKLAEFKRAMAEYIKQAGGDTIENPVFAEQEEFGKNITGLVKKVTSDATATASDIAQGKTAWVNGKQITGTSSLSLENLTWEYKEVTVTAKANEHELSWDLKEIPNYQKLELNKTLNPVMVSKFAINSGLPHAGEQWIMKWSYDPSTGSLTATTEGNGVIIHYGTGDYPMTIGVYYLKF